MKQSTILDVRTTTVRYDSADVQRLDFTSSLDGQKDWALLGGNISSPTWCVCIHGHGSQGDQLYTRPDIRDHWLPTMTQRGMGILTPNLRDNAWMGPAAVHDLHGMLAYLRTHTPARRFVFLSGSMGGTSNLIYAVLHPEDVAAVVALGAAVDLTMYYRWCRERSSPEVLTEIAEAIRCSYNGQPTEQPALYEKHSTLLHSDRLTMPVFFVHGQADAIMPVEQARWLRDKMGTTKSFRFQEVPDGNHDSPLRSAAEAMEWVCQAAPL